MRTAMSEEEIRDTETKPEQDVEGAEQEVLDLGAFPIDSLMIRTESRSVFEVCRRIDSGMYIMDPDFQRDFVWDLPRQSKLVESAVLRVPLPVFYLAETRSGKVVIVDGLQRLTTFHRYLKNHFSLRGLGFAKDLNGRKFDDLPAILKNRIEDMPLTLYLIDSNVPEEAKYEIFERVNGGVPLTRQQMRNCLFVGEATRWLSKMAKDEVFLEATGNSLNWKTMRDRECINRFAGFYRSGVDKYDGKMERFLNDTLREMNDQLGVEDYESLTSAFKQSMRNNCSLFGSHSFRKSLGDPVNMRSVINIALFDVFSVIFAGVDEAIVSGRRETIADASRKLLENPEFVEAISRSTNSSRNVSLRFRLARETLQPLIV